LVESESWNFVERNINALAVQKIVATTGSSKATNTTATTVAALLATYHTSHAVSTAASFLGIN
jgi:hypothetical protein